MGRLHGGAERTARAAPGAVRALVSDATRYPQWGRGAPGHADVPAAPASTAGGNRAGVSPDECHRSGTWHRDGRT